MRMKILLNQKNPDNMFNAEKEYAPFLKAGIIGKTGWSSPSNIALIKYWGKKSNQVPQNPSLSMSLRESRTVTFVTWEIVEEAFSYEFLFEGSRNVAFEPKLDLFFEQIIPLLPYLKNMRLTIQSSNTFPHSTGIASSASAMSALALCLVDIDMQLTGMQMDMPDFLQNASYVARIGSGSAARSVYPNFAVWGETDLVPGSSNLFASPVSIDSSSFFSGLQDAILIVSSEKKEVSSSLGHNLMRTNPYASSRYHQANLNLSLLYSALQKEDQKEFIRIVENEALSLHGLMMGSEPGFILMKHGTIEIIKRVRKFRDETGIFITFTLDAGPNVHILYHEDDEYDVRNFVEEDLLVFAENHRVIWDGIGNGPEKITS